MKKTVIVAALAATVVGIAIASSAIIHEPDTGSSVRLSLDQLTNSFTVPGSDKKWVMELDTPGLHNDGTLTATFVQANTLGASEFAFNYPKGGNLSLDISSTRNDYFEVTTDEAGRCTEKEGVHACARLTKTEWAEVFGKFRAYARSRYPQL